MAFTDRFPEFAEQSGSVVSAAVAEAERFCPAKGWKESYSKAVRDDAVQYLAAHILATRTMQIGNQVGSVSGRPEGKGIESTLYGQEYKRLLDSLPHCGFSY